MDTGVDLKRVLRPNATERKHLVRDIAYPAFR